MRQIILLNKTPQLIYRRQCALQRGVGSRFSVSGEKIDDARETRKNLTLRRRQFADLLAQGMVTLLNKCYQQRVVLGLQQAAKARVEIRCLISEEIHATRTLHLQTRCWAGVQDFTRKEEEENNSVTERINGGHTLYMQHPALVFPVGQSHVSGHHQVMEALDESNRRSRSLHMFPVFSMTDQTDGMGSLAE